MVVLVYYLTINRTMHNTSWRSLSSETTIIHSPICKCGRIVFVLQVRKEEDLFTLREIWAMCFHPLEVFLCHVWWNVAGDLVMIRFQNTIWPSVMALIIGRSTLWFLSFSHEITGKWGLTGFRFFRFICRSHAATYGVFNKSETKTFFGRLRQKVALLRH